MNTPNTTAVTTQGVEISKEHNAAAIAINKAYKAGRITWQSYHRGLEFLKREDNHLRYLVTTYPLASENEIRAALEVKHNG